MPLDAVIALISTQSWLISYYLQAINKNAFKLLHNCEKDMKGAVY